MEDDHGQPTTGESTSSGGGKNHALLVAVRFAAIALLLTAFYGVFLGDWFPFAVLCAFLAFAGPGAIFVSVGNRRPVSTKPQCSVCLGRLKKRNTSTSKPAMHTKCQRYIDGTGSIV